MPTPTDHATSSCLSITHAQYSANSLLENQTAPSRPDTTNAVANASAKPPSGPITVALLAPIAIKPVWGSRICAPRSYVPDVAIAPPFSSKTFKITFAYFFIR